MQKDLKPELENIQKRIKFLQDNCSFITDADKNEETDDRLLEEYALIRSALLWKDSQKINLNNPFKDHSYKWRKQLIRISFGIAASLIVGVMIINYLWPFSLSNTSKTTFVENTKEVLLITSTGAVYNLNSENITRDDGNCTVTNNNGTISYQLKDMEDRQQTDFAMNKLIIPRGTIYKVELSDGTLVWLNAESELSYPTIFTDARRDVYLKGEAYFEVQHADQSPFYVHYANDFTRVYGTKFNINAYHDKSNSYTTLLEGRIAIHTSTGDSCFLVAGEQATITDKGNLVIKQLTDPEMITAWKDGKFIFSNCELADLATQLERWYDIRVIFKNKDLQNIKFRGAINKYLSLDETLKILSKTAPITISQHENVVVISD